MTSLLKFPNVTDFFAWLKERGIHEYGEVIVEDRRTGKHGVTWVSYFIRLSAKDPARQEIAQCEILYFSGMWIRDESRKESEPEEARFKEYVQKKHDEAFKDYAMRVLPAEFQSLGDDKL